MPTERYLINLHVNAGDDLEAALLQAGPYLPSAVRAGLSCDALVRVWIDDQLGNVNLGRTARTVDDALRTVVEHRDRGCRVPGCGATKWLHIHHIWHWERGGPTDTWNLVALCPAHHRAVHRGDITITGNADGELTFTDRNGRPMRHIPPPPMRFPLHDAAFDLGIRHTAWHNRTGERADWRWLAWNDFAGNPPPNHTPDVNQN
jgi:hypothetical protein